MSGAALSVYHRLPPPARSLAASLRGAYLRWWRFGADTEEKVAAALERDAWTAPQWKAWREERLARLLHGAATRVPHYREHWQRRRREGDHASWDLLENWPILTKEELRRDPDRFLDEKAGRRGLYRDRTSGTSGTPLTIQASRATLHDWYALVEARLRRWHGVSIRERWALLGGQLVVPFARNKPPYWVHNLAARQLYLSSHHVRRETVADYARALERFRPSHLLVYPATAAVLAQWMLEEGVAGPPLRVILSNADTVSEGQRAVIQKAFGCPLRDTYGMCEMAAGASECAHGTMHWWPEAGAVEILREDSAAAGPGESGRIVTTGLLNDRMPLIRYAIGDRAQASEPDLACGCGRGLPVLKGLEGRVSDLIVTPDGRRIFWLNPVFYGLGVREAQIVQERVDLLRARWVAGPDAAASTAETIRERLRERVGTDVELRIERVESLPRTAAGKIRPIVGLGGSAS